MRFMVDEIRDVRNRIPGEQVQQGPSQDNVVDRLLGTKPQKPTASKQNDLSSLAQQINNLRQTPHDRWTPGMVKALAKTVEKLITTKQEALAASRSMSEYAVDTATNSLRMQIRQMMATLNPPPEVAGSDDFQGLMEMLWPPAMRRDAPHKFSRGSAIRGTVKDVVQHQLVHQALHQANQKAGQKLMQQGGQGINQNLMNQFGKMSLEQMSRFIRRKMKKLKKGKVLNENGEWEDMTDEERRRERRELQELMELFSLKALETMRCLKEEIAPQWAPEKQPWMLQQGNQQIYDILLATADEEILAETQAWDEMQNLREGNAVFTLRAADKLTEAAARPTKQ